MDKYGKFSFSYHQTPSLIISLKPYNMTLFRRKPVFGVCDQSRLKLACAAAVASYSLEILEIASICIFLSKQRITKVLIRLCRCAGWSALLLFAYGIKQVFSWRGSYVFRTPIDFASASDKIWPHFAAMGMRRTTRSELVQMGVLRPVSTVKFLKIRTPEKCSVITLKFEQGGFIV